MGKFQRSEGYRKVIQFISKCSAALVNTTMESDVNITIEIQGILDILERLDQLIDVTPPHPEEPGLYSSCIEAYYFLLRFCEIWKQSLC